MLQNILSTIFTKKRGSGQISVTNSQQNTLCFELGRASNPVRTHSHTHTLMSRRMAPLRFDGQQKNNRGEEDSEIPQPDLTLLWYVTGTPLELYWYTTGISLVNHCYFTGISLVHHWYTTGISPVLHWYTTGTSPVHQWHTTGTSVVRHWSTTGTSLVHCTGSDVRHMLCLKAENFRQ